ncbi:MAG TPA: hypothetical protein VE911_04280 [Candidatus Nitrosopolaris sp.]|nr:hypothetical protein [Candidatus Nitrosopolaris sp.]
MASDGYPMHAWRWLLGLVVLASCQPASHARPAPAPETPGYPRCLASDADGNQVVCAAPPRAYNGDRCSCANGRGHVFYGRVQEYPPP